MKVAFFHNLPSGGALRAFYEKIEALEKRGCSVSLYTFSTGEKDFLPLPAISGDVFEADLLFSGPWKWSRYLRAARACAEKINASDADLVYVDKCRFLGAPSVLRFLKKSSLFYLHEPLGVREYSRKAEEGSSAFLNLSHDYFRLPLVQKLKKIIQIPERMWIKYSDKRNTLSANRVLTCSRFAQKWIRRVYGIDAEVAYQGVNVSFFAPAPGLKRKREVVSVGRAEPRKGHDFIVDVLAQLQKDLRPRLLVVCDAGEETFRERLKLKALRQGVDLKIVYRPAQEYLRRLYQESAAVLCAGICEPFGLVPLEAGACGTPVIAADEGGYRETVLEGQTGYLIPRNPMVWAEALTKLISNPVLSDELGRNAADHVRKNWSSAFWCDRLAAMTRAFCLK